MKLENPKNLKANNMASTIVNIDDIEAIARGRLNKGALDYYQSGATDQNTLRDNRLAFDRIVIRPRFLVDVSKRSTRTSILGIPIEFPICVSPTAMQKMATPLGEVANAQGNLCIINQQILILFFYKTSLQRRRHSVHIEHHCNLIDRRSRSRNRKFA